MKRKTIVSGAVLGAVLLLGWATMGVKGQTSQEDLVKSSSIVFVGTVSQLGAASFAGVPTSPRTLVVRVDEVLEKPDVISLAAGDDVTVLVQDPDSFQEGAQATFYAEGWILGDGVAVREVGHELSVQTMEAATISEKRSEVSQIRSDLSDADLRARIEAADMVCVGSVVSVRPATRLAAAPGTRPITEHDADWQEAVILVETGIKGVEAGEQVVVRFPASQDIAWHGAPKFTEGQEGTFIMQRDQVTGVPEATLAGNQVPAYTALSPESVLPKEEAARVQSLAQPQ